MGVARSRAWIVATTSRGGHVDDVIHHGHSMAPCLLPGDRLRVRPLTSERDRAPGSILVAELGGRLIAHRLVRWSDDAVHLRGDANLDADHALPHAAIVGVVASASRCGQEIPLARSPLQKVLDGARRVVRTWRP